MRLTISLCAAAAVLSLGVVGTAFAQTDAPSRTVRVADIDFSSRDSTEIALRRIQHAADAVCGGAPSAVDLSQQAPYEQCRKAAIKGAVQQLDRPLLSQIAEGSKPVMVASR